MNLTHSRKESFLNKKRWTIDGVASSWRDRVASLSLCGKVTYIEEYAKAKRLGQYAKLAKPRTEYFLRHREGGEDFILQVPKLVWEDVLAPDLTGLPPY